MADNRMGSESERDIEMEELREELARLKEAIAGRMEEARDVLADRAAVVRENPATFSAALVLGGVIGLMIGMTVGQQDRHRWW
ncbi:MAG: hypothetical protein QM744_01675 [Mesorhizobium sp.]